MAKIIVYINDRRQGRQLYELLDELLEEVGLKGAVSYHHAGACENHRRAVEAGLKDGSLRWVIATDALGMGADISDIQRVIQVRAGESAAAFLQRIGRAGRDGVTPVEGIVLLEKELLKDKPSTKTPEEARATGKAKTKVSRRGVSPSAYLDLLNVCRRKGVQRSRRTGNTFSVPRTSAFASCLKSCFVDPNRLLS